MTGMVTCKVCGELFNLYVLYDLDSGLQAECYICKPCLIREYNTWDIAHGWKHNIDFLDNAAIVTVISL